MKATHYSKEPYYPMLLSNGIDGILVDYSGSNFASHSGHTHWEQSHGAICGWYKATSRTVTKKTEGQILRAGYQVILYNAPAEPESYEQSLDSSTGILTTRLSFAKNEVEVLVESFLTTDGLWCEKVTIEKCDPSNPPQVGFLLLDGQSGYLWMQLQTQTALHVNMGEKEMQISYDFGSFAGKGALWSDRAFAETEKKNVAGSDAHNLGLIGVLSQGESVSRILTIVDETECSNIDEEFEKRSRIAQKGYDAVKAAHVEAWKNENASSVTIPDPKVAQVYEMGQYLIRSSQNPQNGATLLGIQPHLWNGGLYCAYDSIFIIKGLLTSGFIKEAEKCGKFILGLMEIGRQALAAYDMKGGASVGWTDCKGQYSQHRDMKEFITHFKPMYPCFDILNLYNIWNHTGRKTSEELEKALRMFLDFTEHLTEERDGRIFLKNVMSGTEGGYESETDTWTNVALFQSIRVIGDMLNDESLIELSEILEENMACNYNEDGILLPFKDAPFIGGWQSDMSIFMMPRHLSEKNIDIGLKTCETEWGYNYDTPTETYRHWPWIPPRSVICYARLGAHKKAMEQLLKIPMGASSLGVLPEKIRIDGAPINYYYTTPAGLAVWAVNEAMCFEEEGTVCFAYGITKDWQDFSAKNIHLSNGLKADITVSGGVVKELALTNLTEAEITVNLKVNADFAADVPDVVTIAQGAKYSFKA